MTQIITGLISVARDWRLVHKMMLDLYFQIIAKTNYKYVTLKSIKNEVRKTDEIQYFVGLVTASVGLPYSTCMLVRYTLLTIQLLSSFFSRFRGNDPMFVDGTR